MIEASLNCGRDLGTPHDRQHVHLASPAPQHDSGILLLGSLGELWKVLLFGEVLGVALALGKDEEFCMVPS